MIFLMNIPQLLNAQDDCSKMDLCEKDDFEDYDYRGQSSFGTLMPGDTARIKLVLYSGQDYHIFICGEEHLGQLEFNVVREKRKYRNVVDEVKEEEVIIYKENEYGAYEYDEYGNYIEVGRETVYDTIWKRELYIDRNVLFSSIDDGVREWHQSLDKTLVGVVEVIVPENAQSEGCVAVMVGHRYKPKRKFKRGF